MALLVILIDFRVKELKKNADNSMMRKDYEEALEIYTLLIEKEPTVERHYYKRGQIHEKLKKFRKALQVNLHLRQNLLLKHVL